MARGTVSNQMLSDVVCLNECVISDQTLTGLQRDQFIKVGAPGLVSTIAEKWTV